MPRSVAHITLASLVFLAASPGVDSGPAPIPVPHHPHDVVDDVDLTPSYGQDRTVFVASSGTMRLFLKSDNGGYSWRNARRGMRGSTVHEFEAASDWAESGTGYAVLGKRGLQRTTDGASTFSQVFDEYLNLLAMPPVQDGRHTLFMGHQRSLWRSDDGGETQRHLNIVGLGGAEIVTLAVSPTFAIDHTVAAGVRQGAVLISRDGGETWTAAPVAGQPQRIAFSPRFAEDGTMWIATHGGRVQCSRDGGVQFAESATGIDDSDVNYVAVAPTYPECRDLYAATRDDGVYRSRDGGETWELTPLDPQRTSQTKNHFARLALSPDYPADPTVFCGAYEGLYISHDFGEQWFESNMNPTRIGRKIKISDDYANDGTVFAATYGNPFLRSTDRGESWAMESTNLRSISVYCIAPAPNFAKEQLVMLGVVDGVRRSDDGGVTWESIALPPVQKHERYANYQIRRIHYSSNFAEDRTVFAIHSGGLYRSTDAGKTWKGAVAPSLWPWVIELSNEWHKDRTMFVGGLSLHRSLDDGATWTDSLYDDRIMDVVCPPDFAQRGEVFALAERDGVLRSRDHGLTWEPIEGALGGFGAASFRLSPNFLEDGTIYVTTLGGGLFVTRDRGETWQRWTELGSPVDACFEMALSPAFEEDGTVFAGTFEGIWRSTDKARTWQLVTSEEFYDEARAPWLLHGANWQKEWYPEVYCRCVMKSDVAGHEATLPFSGTGVRVYGAKGPDHGMAEVLVDGKVMASVDLYSMNRVNQHVIYENQDLPFGVHDVTVRVLGTKRDAARGAWVSVDAGTVHYMPPGDEPTPVFTSSAQLRHTPAGTKAMAAQSPAAPAAPAGGSSLMVMVVLGAVGLAVVGFLVMRRPSAA